MAVKKRVLVVDDEPGVLRFVNIGLTAAGYDVTATTSGEEAIKLAQAQTHDIVLLDLLMVPIDGFDVLKRLRTFSEVPVIVFSARSFVTEQVMKLGANDFIGKPFRPEDLIKKIESTLKPRQSDSNRPS